MLERQTRDLEVRVWIQVLVQIFLLKFNKANFISCISFDIRWSMQLENNWTIDFVSYAYKEFDNLSLNCSHSVMYSEQI